MTNDLPAWMGPSCVPAPIPLQPLRFRRFLRGALGGFARLLEDLLDNEAIARQPGFLQRLDPRSKVLALLGLIVIATFLTRPFTLGLAFGAASLLALLSGIPFARLRRVWTAVPLFSAALMAPALLNVVTPGQALLHWKGLAITDTGLLAFLRFILRTTTCLTLVLSLTATTRPSRLFRGLRALGVPQIFVTLLGMMERYLAVMTRTAQEIHLAKLSRTVVPGSLQQDQAWVAAGMGSLFLRSRALGEEVFQAMLSRGYTGAVHTLEEPRFRLTDWAFLMVAAGLGTLFLVLG